MNSAEFAAKVRSKYPGAYDDVPDDELTRRVQAKYPGAYDDVTTSNSAANPFAGVRASGYGTVDSEENRLPLLSPYVQSTMEGGKDFVDDTIIGTGKRVARNVVGIGKAIGNEIGKPVRFVDALRGGDWKGMIDAASPPLMIPQSMEASIIKSRDNFGKGEFEQAATEAVRGIPVVGGQLSDLADQIGVGAQRAEERPGHMGDFLGDVATGELLGGAMKAAPGVGSKLRKGGASFYESGMNPQKLASAERTIQRMFDEGITNSTDLSPRIKAVGEALDIASDTHGSTLHAADPIVRDINKLKDQYLTDNGTVTHGRQKLIDEIDRLEGTLRKAQQDGSLTTRELTIQRKALDDIAAGRGAFEGVEKSTAAASLAKNMADVLRERLNSIDDIAKANAEYSYLTEADQIRSAVPGIMEGVAKHGTMAVINTLRGFMSSGGVNAGRAVAVPGMRIKAGLAMDRTGSALGGKSPFPAAAIPPVDPFGYTDAVTNLSNQLANYPNRATRSQAIAQKKIVYTLPNGVMVKIPPGIKQSFADNFGLQQGTTSIQRYLDAMKKKGIVPEGGKLEFLDE